MPNNWRKYTLNDISRIGDGAHAKVERKDNGILYLTSKNFKEGKLVLEKVDFISEEDYEKLFSVNSKAIRRPQTDDIILGIIGTIGNAYCYKAIDKFGISSSVALIRPDNEKVLSKYLYYYIISNTFKHYQNSHNGASVQGYTNIPSLKSIPIELPPLPEQQAIAEILSSLDDKIELNLQTNKTLEEMANALYKHWFVDFGPFQNGKFIESELGLIPEDWEVVNIGDFVETLGGGTPSTTNEDYWLDGNINWYSPTDLTKQKSLFSGYSEKRITNLGLSKSSARLFPAYSLLMSSRATIGLITINTKEACTNQGFITILPNKLFSLYQLHGWLIQNMELIISKSNGSTFKEISKSNFRELKILKAKNINSFLSYSKEIFSLIENNINENISLKQTRDYLLPKLISGEIRVKDAAKKLKKVL